MPYDYDKLYGETRDALGEPTAIFVDFFERYDNSDARVLDVGCGQGRDAIFIARRGHRVLGVDLSPNGISDLQAVADKEKLAVEGVVANITNFTPPSTFDIILIDRTLHMLAQSERISVLSTLLDHVDDEGWLLIADEASNIEEFLSTIATHGKKWTVKYQKRGLPVYSQELAVKKGS